MNMNEYQKLAARTCRPMVYVCSPFSGDVVRNIATTRKYSRFAVEQGYLPIAPHLLFPQFLNDNDMTEREMAMHFNYVLLGKCNELWVFGGVISKGMAREIGVAKKRRMKIRWFNWEMKEFDEIAQINIDGFETEKSIHRKDGDI